MHLISSECSLITTNKLSKPTVWLAQRVRELSCLTRSTIKISLELAVMYRTVRYSVHLTFAINVLHKTMYAMLEVKYHALDIKWMVTDHNYNLHTKDVDMLFISTISSRIRSGSIKFMLTGSIVMYCHEEKHMANYACFPIPLLHKASVTWLCGVNIWLNARHHHMLTIVGVASWFWILPNLFPKGALN